MTKAGGDILLGAKESLELIRDLNYIENIQPDDYGKLNRKWAGRFKLHKVYTKVKT